MGIFRKPLVNWAPGLETRVFPGRAWNGLGPAQTGNNGLFPGDYFQEGLFWFPGKNLGFWGMGDIRDWFLGTWRRKPQAQGAKSLGFSLQTNSWGLTQKNPFHFLGNVWKEPFFENPLSLVTGTKISGVGALFLGGQPWAPVKARGQIPR